MFYIGEEKLKNKKIKILIMVFVLLCFSSKIVKANEVEINNLNYITFVPVRETFESMDYEVQWNKSNNSILLKGEN